MRCGQRERSQNDVYDRVLPHSQRGQCSRHARSHYAYRVGSGECKGQSQVALRNFEYASEPRWLADFGSERTRGVLLGPEDGVMSSPTHGISSQCADLPPSITFQSQGCSVSHIRMIPSWPRPEGIWLALQVVGARPSSTLNRFSLTGHNSYQ